MFFNIPATQSRIHMYVLIFWIIIKHFFVLKQNCTCMLRTNLYGPSPSHEWVWGWKNTNTCRPLSDHTMLPTQIWSSTFVTHITLAPVYGFLSTFTVDQSGSRTDNSPDEPSPSHTHSKELSALSCGRDTEVFLK